MQAVRNITQLATRRFFHVSRVARGDEGSIRKAGGSFAQKEQAQENMWAHKRDLERLKELQEQLKKAHTDLEHFTEQMISKNKDKK